MVPRVDLKARYEGKWLEENRREKLVIRYLELILGDYPEFEVRMMCFGAGSIVGIPG